jgi:hypothetical protein
MGKARGSSWSTGPCELWWGMALAHACLAPARRRANRKCGAGQSGPGLNLLIAAWPGPEITTFRTDYALVWVPVLEPYFRTNPALMPY